MLLAGRFVLLPIMWDMGAILHCLAHGNVVDPPGLVADIGE